MMEDVGNGQGFSEAQARTTKALGHFSNGPWWCGYDKIKVKKKETKPIL